MYLKQGDYIELKTGNIAKVLEIKHRDETTYEYEHLYIRMRVLTKGYTYQYEKRMKLIETKCPGFYPRYPKPYHKWDWKWVKRKFNQEDILRLIGDAKGI